MEEQMWARILHHMKNKTLRLGRKAQANPGAAKTAGFTADGRGRRKCAANRGEATRGAGGSG